jgi:glycosyltransferase involved in cell wall biosynthesis
MIDGLQDRRVALAHHWLIAMRGGEKTLNEIAGLIEEAPIFALLADPDRLGGELRRRPIHTSFLQRLPVLRRRHRFLLPLMPRAADAMDLTDYDVVICSDAAVAKGFHCRPDALKICYCHSPMRYVWDLYEDYRREAGWLGGMVLSRSVDRLRQWDRAAAGTVSAFVANSDCVRDRIRRAYDCPSTVIYPPVAVAKEAASSEPEDFYLVVSELIGYKRTDLAVRACTRLGRPLVVIGDGPQRRELRDMAGPTVTMMGYQPDSVVDDHMRRCHALLFCGEEDFGLVPVEVQGHGRPVIAFGRGGACETVLDGDTGLFFPEQSVEAVIETIERFERLSDRLWTSERIHRHARQFDTARFCSRFSRFVRWCLGHHDRGGPEAVRQAMESLAANQFLGAE